MIVEKNMLHTWHENFQVSANNISDVVAPQANIFQYTLSYSNVKFLPESDLISKNQNIDIDRYVDWEQERQHMYGYVSNLDPARVKS